MSIYVGVNPDDLHRLRPVLNLFFQQAIGLQTRELPERNPALKYQVMMLLDEFTALGRIPIIAEAISYLPGLQRAGGARDPDPRAAARGVRDP